MADSPVLPLALVALYMAFNVGWALFYSRRLNPWIRKRVGNYFGFEVVEATRHRSQSWVIRGEHTRQQGCLVGALNFATTFGCLAIPIFAALAAVVGAMAALSGE